MRIRNAFRIAAVALWAGILMPASVRGQSFETKFGFVHFAEALQSVDEVKAEIDVVQQFVEEKNQENKAKTDELAKLREDLANKARTLNADAQSELQRSIQDKETTFKRFWEDTRREIEQRRNAIFAKYGPKMQEIIKNYAEQNGFQVIFLLDQLDVGYVDDSLDITEQVVAAYNAEHPGGGASSS